jgi:ribose-phosphate pyrophosphokinase
MSWRGKTIAAFEHQEVLARALARELGARFVTLTIKTYPAGERVVCASSKVTKRTMLVSDVEADGEGIWRLRLATDALRRSGARTVILFAPWMAYGRQDRPAAVRESVGGIDLGEALHLLFNKIVTIDVHSKLFASSFHGRLTSVFPAKYIAAAYKGKGITAVAAPDLGARKRARKVARKLKVPFIQCVKKRSRPGAGGVRMCMIKGDVKDHRVLLVDDLVDSGSTLKEASVTLKSQGAKSVGAYVSHTAIPSSVPGAKNLRLKFLDVVYQRGKKPSREFLKFIARRV